MLYADDEQDENLDEEESDADTDENSDEDEEEGGDDENDSGEDSDDSDGDSDEDEDSDEDDDKPVTQKQLREALKGNKNNRNAQRRVSSKNRDSSKRPTNDSKRLDTIEQSLKQTQLLERKRDFGYQHQLSPKQVNHVFRLTKRPTASFLAKPHVKAALDAIKSSENVRPNTPSNSGRTFKNRDGKEKAWTELKPEERQSNFADRRRGILERKRG